MINNPRRTVVANIDNYITVLKTADSTQHFPLQQSDIENLCFLCRSVLISQSMLIQINPPVIICGDIHGQYRDLLGIFKRIGEPHQRNYLFLGDYVDRGKKSLQCFCLLMAYKIKYSHNFFILRGNHETSELNKIYGFYDECKRKFSIKLWKTISDVFSVLPIAAIVGNRIFCVHGGLSPQLTSLQSINLIKRPVEQIIRESLSCDILWSDPNNIMNGWHQNYERGVSFTFGKDVVDLFLEKYDLDCICRSHQVVEEGYQFFHQRKLITIFSAPNYCGEFNNMGAVLKVSKNMVCKIQQFEGTLKKFRLVRSVTPINLQKTWSDKGKSPSKTPQKQNSLQENSQSKRQKKKRKVTRMFVNSQNKSPKIQTDHKQKTDSQKMITTKSSKKSQSSQKSSKVQMM